MVFNKCLIPGRAVSADERVHRPLHDPILELNRSLQGRHVKGRSEPASKYIEAAANGVV